MKLPSALAFSLLLPVAFSTQGQTVYRCGNSYSQQPCVGGSAVDTSDSRTPEQRKAQERTAQQQKRSADDLEKNRVKEEAAAARAAEQADKAQRGAEKEKQNPAQTPPKSQPAKDRIPAYRAPAGTVQK